jgi:hypothetical protein
MLERDNDKYFLLRHIRGCVASTHQLSPHPPSSLVVLPGETVSESGQINPSGDQIQPRDQHRFPLSLHHAQWSRRSPTTQRQIDDATDHDAPLVVVPLRCVSSLTSPQATTYVHGYFIGPMKKEQLGNGTLIFTRHNT